MAEQQRYVRAGACPVRVGSDAVLETEHALINRRIPVLDSVPACGDENGPVGGEREVSDPTVVPADDTPQLMS